MHAYLLVLKPVARKLVAIHERHRAHAAVPKALLRLQDEVQSHVVLPRLGREDVDRLRDELQPRHELAVKVQDAAFQLLEGEQVVQDVHRRPRRVLDVPDDLTQLVVVRVAAPGQLVDDEIQADGRRVQRRAQFMAVIAPHK